VGEIWVYLDSSTEASRHPTSRQQQRDMGHPSFLTAQQRGRRIFIKRPIVLSDRDDKERVATDVLWLLLQDQNSKRTPICMFLGSAPPAVAEMMPKVESPTP
jgi:hypothetical protein